MRDLYKRLGLIALLAVFAIAGMSAVSASDKAQTKNEVCQEKQEMLQAKQALKEFRETIDRWHMANLEGDQDRINHHQGALFGMIRADIKESHVSVQRREKEASQSAGNLQGSNDRQQKKDLRIGLANLKTARQLTMAKEKLFFALKRSKTFSNKYRLLNDYVGLLQREIGVVRMELAEDIQEARPGK